MFHVPAATSSTHWPVVRAPPFRASIAAGFEGVANAPRPEAGMAPIPLCPDDPFLLYVQARDPALAAALEWSGAPASLHVTSLRELAERHGARNAPYRYVTKQGVLTPLAKSRRDLLLESFVQAGRNDGLQRESEEVVARILEAHRQQLQEQALSARQREATQQAIDGGRAPSPPRGKDLPDDPVFHDHLWQRNPPLLIALQWMRLRGMRLRGDSCISLRAYSQSVGLAVPPTCYIRPMGRQTVGDSLLKHERAAFEWSSLPADRKDLASLGAITEAHHLQLHDLVRYVPARELLFRDGPASCGALDDETRHALNRDVIRHVEVHCPDTASTPAWRAAVAWSDTRRAERFLIGMGPFASRHGVRASVLRSYVTFDGEITAFALREKGGYTWALKDILQQQVRPPAPTPTADPVVAAEPCVEEPAVEEPVVEEPVVEEPVVVKDEPADITRHAYDNQVPILQTPDGDDALAQALQPPQKRWRSDKLEDLIQRQEVHAWSLVGAALEDSVQALPERERKQALKRERLRMTEEARAWLAMSPEDRARRLDTTLRVVPAGPGLGLGVQAARDISAFEVLGPYAGRFLPTPAHLEREQARYGIHNVGAYLYGTQADSRTVSAFPVGNVLSKVNEAQLPADNNVGVIRLGTNLTFYVANRAIAEGEDVLVDYGPEYDRAGWQAHPIEVHEGE